MRAPLRPPELVGESRVFLDALTHASNLAALDRPLLILGERGSGKELIAARVHFLSPRWERPLVKVNCAALSEELLESELFGHEAGAFTGAQKRHVGRFERAEGGTLFLDEIASASFRVQEKLLRVIEYGEYERLGGEATLVADVRVVAAANVDLSSRAAAGKFRADLLDRLAFDVVAAPPLRARKGDVPVLAGHFGAAFAKELGGEPGFEGFTPGAMAALMAYDWPGNVRELKNAVERSVFRWRAAGRAGPVDAAVISPFECARLPEGDAEAASPVARAAAERAAAPTDVDLRAHLDGVERRLAAAALDACGGNQKRAAQRLRLTYDQMRGLVRKHDLAARA
jgi:psp operon transcriptional activator